MSAFTKVNALRPGRSVFNLSYQKQFDCDFGELVPVCLEEMVPGDTFKVGNEIVVRFHPLNAPVLAEINAYVHYFFVPTRLIFDGWENFITGGVDGQDATALPRLVAPNPSFVSKYSLYDYFGFPLVNDSSGGASFPGDFTTIGTPEYNMRPLAFPWYVYNKVWNEFYRDETLQDEVALNQPNVLNRNWNKDYFTSALPWQQRGVAPALPLSGTGSAVWDDGFSADVYSATSPISSGNISTNRANVRSAPAQTGNNPVYVGQGMTPPDNPHSINVYPLSASIGVNSLNNNTIDMSNVATFDVSDLRLAFQVQKWMERNARSGVRYTEFLHAHYGVSPRDDRLQRPEYLGGSKSPVLISEVVQTSESGTTPQGTLKGKGITADKNFICNYTAKEFGYIIGIMSIMPKPGYFQGVDRKWLRSSRFDWFTPEFGHLSEQAVTTEEIYAMAGASRESGIGNDTIFGYQARFNEMRQNHDMYCGDLRPNGSLGYWNLGRYFDSVPQLNSDFISMNASNDHLKRIFAVQDVKGIIVNFANIITAIRPIPKFGEPGLIDHN